MYVTGRARRFDWVKNECGFAKFFPIKDFEEPTNGFLVYDTSFFGVEVLVTESSCPGECLSMSKVANISGKYEWVIDRFSKLGKYSYSDKLWYLHVISILSLTTVLYVCL